MCAQQQGQYTEDNRIEWSRNSVQRKVDKPEANDRLRKRVQRVSTSPFVGSVM